MIMPVLRSTSRVCPHWRVTWDPAATVATLVEMITNGLGPPLQVMSADVTSVMGCEERLLVSGWHRRGIQREERKRKRKKKKKEEERKRRKRGRRKAHPIIGGETHEVTACLHNSIDTDLLEDGVRRSSTRKDERSNNGPHIESVHGSVLEWRT